jgi:PAS domain S-box-containing protein
MRSGETVMNILVVDDHEANRYLLETMFKADGHGVQSVSNGAEALEKLRAGGCDLIISDILMPVMDGFQLCRIVKSDEALRHIPLIIYTATYTGPQDEEFAMMIGADRFIQKPCEPDVFIRVVGDVMEAAGGRDGNSRPDLPEEEEVLKLYSERLVRKLEQKMLQAEREIQKRKEVEDTLKESEEKLRRITNSAQDAIIMMDDQGKISFWNEAAERVFGYSHQEIMGNDLHTILAPRRFYDIAQKGFGHFRETGQGPYLDNIAEFAGMKKGGIEFPIELSLSSVKIHERWHAIGIIRDITERKRIETEQKELEKKLQQSQRMEAIGTLAGGIAHDFNNLLTAIMGYTELSFDKIEKGSIIEGYLHEVYSAGKRAKDLVNQILAVARETNEEVKPTRIDAIVKEVLKFIRSTIPTTIDIKQSIESDSLIMGNATRVHQIVMNLCTNAAHAMLDKGGILKVGLKDVTIENPSPIDNFELKTGDYIEITVSDTGTGISPEIIGSIFEPYFTTKVPGEGTGMGLSVVHGIVESYGGKISVNSELGKGTVFRILLPITQKRKIRHTFESGELPSGSERILFLDDEAPIARMGSQMLEHLGYTVTASTSSVDALELFRSKPNDFDLVVTDMTMPDITGDKLAVELMEIRPDIPVILYTGYSKMISDETAKKMGIKALAYKPILKTDLSKIVRKVLDEASASEFIRNCTGD